MQLDAVTGAFLSAMYHSLRPNTRRAYRYDLGLLTRTFPHLDAADLTVEHLRAFLQASGDQAPATLARRQAAVRSCLAWAYCNDLLPADPTGKLDKVTLPQRDPRPLPRLLSRPSSRRSLLRIGAIGCSSPCCTKRGCGSARRWPSRCPTST